MDMDDALKAAVPARRPRTTVVNLTIGVEDLQALDEACMVLKTNRSRALRAAAKMVVQHAKTKTARHAMMQDDDDAL